MDRQCRYIRNMNGSSAYLNGKLRSADYGSADSLTRIQHGNAYTAVKERSADIVGQRFGDIAEQTVFPTIDVFGNPSREGDGISCHRVRKRGRQIQLFGGANHCFL